MKPLLFLMVAGFSLVACNSNENKAKETTADTVKKTETVTPPKEQLFACEMHPEVIGKKDDKCPKCGMNLTVPVKE